MKYIFLTLVYFLCAFKAFSSDMVEVKIPHNKLTTSPTIDVFIDGKGPFTFVLDTGASHSSLALDVAKEINIPIMPNTYDTVKKLKTEKKVQVSEKVYVEIGSKKIPRETRFYINPRSITSNNKDGVLGVADLFGGKLINTPADKSLKLLLPKRQKICDFIETPKLCNDQLFMPALPMRLGGKSGLLLVDTGNNAAKPFVFLGGNLNDMIWSKYGPFIPSEKKLNLSDTKVKHIRSRDFEFNGSECLGDFFIRDPKDGSPNWGERAIASLGWRVLSRESFEIDFTTGIIKYPTSCPYHDKNTVGIKSFNATTDKSSAYLAVVENHSPASRAGIKEGDWLERVILENGEVFESFDTNFYLNLYKHFYAKPGTSLTLTLTRNEREFEVNLITAKTPITEINFGDTSTD